MKNATIAMQVTPIIMSKSIAKPVVTVICQLDDALTEIAAITEGGGVMRIAAIERILIELGYLQA